MRVQIKPAPRGGRGATDQLRNWMHQGLYDLPHDSALLALGCEQAFLAPHLAEYASDLTVLDSSADQVAQLAPRFGEIAFLPHAPASPLPFARETFDAIWCCEFLDRVFDPVAALREMHRVLTPGGRLLVSVPDQGAVRNVLLALFSGGMPGGTTYPRIRHFNRVTLAKAARAAGFGQISLSTGGAGRRGPGTSGPRSLLLRAKKGPGLRLPMAQRLGSSRQEVFGAELAYATRTRAA